jgi:hypothetical protein
VRGAAVRETAEGSTLVTNFDKPEIAFQVWKLNLAGPIERNSDPVILESRGSLAFAFSSIKRWTGDRGQRYALVARNHDNDS